MQPTPEINSEYPGFLQQAGFYVLQIPSAWLSLFDVIFLIVLIPVMDRIIYPRLDATGWHLSLRMRILIGQCRSFGELSKQVLKGRSNVFGSIANEGNFCHKLLVGMVFAILSICTAGGLEMMRLHYYWKDNKEHIHYQCIGMSRCNRIQQLA